MKYIYNISQISKLSLTLHTFSITGLAAGLFLTLALFRVDYFIVKHMAFSYSS